MRYLPGEGVLGMVLERGERVMLPRLADEPRFLDRLRLYDRELPLIGVPIPGRSRPVRRGAGRPAAGFGPVVAGSPVFWKWSLI